ncbi:MAG TPA: leucyl/phenylalanyl-tRNA--protein transferase, partial [Bdellovibrionales bacterium]|nr:leucyl/phenylalanyl-tRNA--protein transferase [Bdellovibrionales bacterium]
SSWAPRASRAKRGAGRGRSLATKLPLIPDLFPDPESADESGVVCIGGPLSVPVLVTAYYSGIFPWPHPGLPLLWFSPTERGVLEFKNLHVPRSLARSRKKLNLRFTLNQAFGEVMRGCAKQPRRDATGTWITPEMLKGYKELHEAGYAHSLEAWEGDTLIGGIYGVFVAGVFSGESMFGLKTDVSKLCLVRLVEYLETLGLEWIDIQMVTSVTGLLGGKEVKRKAYLKKIAQAHTRFEKNEIVAPSSASF